ncbi:hypothetical protein ABG067_006421 [Albugo candida]
MYRKYHNINARQVESFLTYYRELGRLEAAVPPDGAHFYIMLKVGEHQEAYKQKNNFLKHFVTPVSIELKASKVRNVLRVIKCDETGGASSGCTWIKVDKHDFEGDLTRAVDEFMDIAETDISVDVSFEDFKAAKRKQPNDNRSIHLTGN